MNLDESSSVASGHNKTYYESEERLLIELKSSGLSWREIELEFNKNVQSDRQRTASALENKWRQLCRDLQLQGRYYPLKLGHCLIHMNAPAVRAKRAPWVWVRAGGAGLAD